MLHVRGGGHRQPQLVSSPHSCVPVGLQASGAAGHEGLHGRLQARKHSWEHQLLRCQQLLHPVTFLMQQVREREREGRGREREGLTAVSEQVCMCHASTFGASKQAGQFSGMIGRWLPSANTRRSFSRTYTKGRITLRSPSLEGRKTAGLHLGAPPLPSPAPPLSLPSSVPPTD